MIIYCPDKLYAAGGLQSNTAESYDPREPSWSMIPSMKFMRYALACVSLDNYIYAIGKQYVCFLHTANIKSLTKVNVKQTK